MLLAIDVGNTNTKFAIWDGQTWRAQWRASTDSTRTADEYAPWLQQVMSLSGLSFSDLTACIVSTVVPQALFNLRNLSRRYIGGDPMVIGEDGLKLGIEIRIDKPNEAGADRLVNAVGAFIEYGGPAIVIDSGTATTFDVVAADGAFEGGIILPGINLSLQALHDAAARLPRVEIRDPGRVIGKDTVTAMQSGIYWGSIEMIEGLCRRMKAEYGKPMKTIATGGVASLFENAFPSIDHFDQDLTSRGLLEIFRRNGGKL
ncbi:MAG TPA: type III pantothenate kinase [Candidatus Binatia bacterium]|nr:type III pantothenate kinase [Candidatus Binatia bacterium]